MPSRRRRLDAELVRRGLARGRGHAKALIERGDVAVDGAGAPKPATLVAAETAITVAEGSPAWAGRGGIKLEAGLDAFEVDPAGARALDVGASTGGFTDVLLARGAAAVVALDVGYGQLLWRLAQDPRVTVVDRTNFRTADVAALGAPFDLIVADVSFISLGLLAPNLAAAGDAGTRYVVLVKPQFEVGKQKVGRGGVVRSESDRAEAIVGVCRAFHDVGIGADDVICSPITGSKGNVEFLLSARHGAPLSLTNDAIQRTVTP